MFYELKYLTPSIISNRQTLIVRRENAFCKFHTFFGFVYHVTCSACFETKNIIRCFDAPKYAFTHRNLPKSKTVKFLERGLASMLMRYCCSMIGCCLGGVFFASCFEINVFYFTNLDKLFFFK